MAKITRKRLARGTKLMPEHISTPLAAAASELENINIEKEQMQAQMAPFCVNLSLPYLSHETMPIGTLSIPFALPPTQDYFVGTGVYDPAAPQVKLRSISFSWDQRAEPAAIASQFWDLSGSGIADTGKYGYSSEQGKLTYDDVAKLDIVLTIRSKDQSYFGVDSYPHKLQRELWSQTLPASLFSGTVLRANPFLATDLNIFVDQYQTFVFTVSCPGLNDSGKRFLALPSIEVSMKFVAELTTRDSGQTDVQNIPRRGGSGDSKWGAKTAPTVTINTPTSGTAIEADGSDGVEHNITVIDDEFMEKLSGGYDRYGDVPPTETLKDAAAYEVIAVPIFQNAANGGISACSTFSATWPYIGTRPTPVANKGIFDRRVIPLHHSYTIHHAILAWNWTPYATLGYFGAGTPPMAGSGAPTAAQQRSWLVAPTEDLGLQVGVGIGTGMGADGFGYQGVAYMALTDPNNTAAGNEYPDGWGVGSTLIDRVLTSSQSTPVVYVTDGATPTPSPVGLPKWNWELHSIPLINTSPAGVGYYAQGKPAFVGPGWTTTQTRSTIGGNPSDTGGAEQWIEVRALLAATDASLAVSEAEYSWDATKTIGDKESLLVGYGGCYVYLICKKTLTS